MSKREKKETLNLKYPSLMIINGKQGSGKSHLIKYLFHENNLSKDKFDYGLVFSKTIFEGSFDFIPKKFQFKEFNEQALAGLIKLQEKNVTKGLKVSAFVIFDDCFTNRKDFNSKSLDKLCIMLRHYNISVFLATQYCNMVLPTIRSNCMYSAFFNVGQGKNETEALFKAYGLRFKTLTNFMDYYYKNTRNNKFIMYDNDSEEFVTYKCPAEIPDFKFKFTKTIQK